MFSCLKLYIEVLIFKSFETKVVKMMKSIITLLKLFKLTIALVFHFHYWRIQMLCSCI